MPLGASSYFQSPPQGLEKKEPSPERWHGVLYECAVPHLAACTSLAELPRVSVADVSSGAVSNGYHQQGSLVGCKGRMSGCPLSVSKGCEAAGTQRTRTFWHVSHHGSLDESLAPISD